ncbi:AbrB/MazE/SpoVT family DNA-binding domain-containing protein [Candidatus Microgenomates bacterium]|nr:AbrB/MazE/SpoVT family DNA-binding domain-containing protein [Candidatus Microgenomates bacterium]
MGIRKADETHIRKLFTIGQQRSYGVILPIGYIRKLGWRDGMELTVRLQNGAIVVRDRKKS